MSPRQVMKGHGIGIPRTTCLLLAATLLACGPRSARSADRLDSDPAWFAAAGAFANRHFALAADELARLLQRYPGHGRLRMLLADTYDRLGRLTAARDLYQAALKAGPGDPEKSMIAESLARLARRIETEPAPPGDDPLFTLTPARIAAMSVTEQVATRWRTEHFDIVTNNGQLTALLADRVEAMLKHVQRTVQLEALFPHRVELTVYPDRERFLAGSGQPHWCGGTFRMATAPDGQIRRSIALYQVDAKNRFRSELLSRELPHELTHLVLREYFGQTQTPLWLEEGLACMSESDAGRALAARMPELLAEKKQLPLADMIDQLAPEIAQGNSSYYVQAASFTRFLRLRLSDAQMKTLLGQLKDGQKPSVALSRTLVLDNRPGWLADIEQRWHAWVREADRNHDGRSENVEDNS